MTTLTLLDNDRGTLTYFEDTNIVFNVFTEKTTEDDFKTMLDAGIDALAQHGGNKWLSDNRHFHIPIPAEWVFADWMPRAIEFGWKYWSIAVPDGMEERADMIQFINAFAQNGVKVRVFTTVEAAQEWIESVD